MGIVDEDIQRVREATDTVAIIGASVGLRRVGQRWTGLCPFHNEKSPSFSVNAEEGLYYCFGCQASGDIITFVRQTEGLDFAESVEFLAEKAGISLRYTEAGVGERREKTSKYHDALGAAVEFYHDRLMSGSDAGAARSYLRSRGYDAEVVRQFQIGWSPEGWDDAVRALKLPRDVLIGSGLAFVNSRGKLTDSFRGRVMFPIFDVAGKPVGFGGRIMPGAEGPKYKNSAQGPVYDKSRVLYGLSWAKKSAVERGRVVICEGYTDVIAFARAGIPEAVATCGTSLTENHVKVLRRFAPRLVLAFDADTAGQGAAQRVYAWERTHDLEVSVVSLPDGRDPGEVGAENPEALAAAVDDAQPFLGWRIDRILAGGSTDTPEHRARTARAALDAVAEHPDEFVRDQYLMQVADRTNVDIDQLRRQRPSPGGQPGRMVAVADEPPPDAYEDDVVPAAHIERCEMEALKLAFHRRAEIEGHLHVGLFPTAAGRALFPVVSSGRPMMEYLDDLHPALQPLVRRVAVEDSDADAPGVLIPLVRMAGERAVRHLTDKYGRTEQWRDHVPTLQWLNGRLAELADDTTQEQAVAALSDWLGQWDEAA